MALTERENYLRTATFRGHEWIPGSISISESSWHGAGPEIEEVVLRHPTIWPDYIKGSRPFERELDPGTRRTKTDEWGAVWEYALDGLEGIVVGHPLDDWSKLASYTPPDPLDFDGFDLEKLSIEWRKAADEGRLARYTLGHGFLFMRLYYMRGYENFMMDVATEAPELGRLVDMVATYYETRARAVVAEGMDVLEAGDDLGTQTSSMIGPKHFARWLAPAYRRVFAPALEAKALVALHSDGYIMDLVDEIAKTGVTIINPQDLVNGIDDLAREVKGRMAIRLDIDRQRIVPFGTPAEIRELIEEEVRTLGSPEGGLELLCDVYPPTPPENVEAVASAMEELRTSWAEAH
jgi:uroporphyrinogen decarboxylase